MALGVEQHWAERFTRVFEQRESQGQAYHPLWYTGVFHSNHPGRFTQNIGKGFTAAISVASVPPGSSSGGSLSGGGGGFSGGGGGGGGGGGW